MGYIGILVLFIAVIYLVYSFLCRNHINIYIKKYNIRIIERKKILRLQFYSSLLNSIYLFVNGVFLLIKSIPNWYIILMPLGIHLINYLIVVIGKKKGYVK